MSYEVSKGQLGGSGRRKYADGCEAEKLINWRLVINTLSDQPDVMITELFAGHLENIQKDSACINISC